VVVAHWFGHLADVSAAGAVHPDALLIEDAAQGVGGSLRGRPLGSFGSVSVLSFGRGKGMPGGGGGALLAHDERGMEIVRWAKSQPGPGGRGWWSLAALAAQGVLGRPSLYGIPAALPFLHLGETVYHPPRAPRGAAAAPLAVLDAIWAASDREIEVRKAHGARLAEVLARSPSLQPMLPVSGGEAGCLRLPALVREAGHAAGLAESGAPLGVARGYPLPLITLPSLRPRVVSSDVLPGAARLASSLLTLPTHGFLAERDLRRLEAWAASGGTA
jgi:dTDP-4-amino-4,6-dideoxygalactose transaminase